MMKKAVLFIFLVFLIVGCSETEILDETGKMEITDINLPDLPQSYVYQGWLLVDGSFVSVGKFNNDSIQNNRARFDKIDMGDLRNAQSFAVTVERDGSGAPSDYVLLLGNFENQTAMLDVMTETHNGIPTLAKRISGSFTVQNASVPEDEAGNYGINGIWFFKGSEENKEPTLELDYSELVYQAWMKKEQDGIEWDLNMGVIKSDTLADNYRGFIPQPYTLNIPKFPGEDFLQRPNEEIGYPEGFFPTDVRGSKIIITPIYSNYSSIETPFPIHLLEAKVPTDAVKDSNLTRELIINTDYSAKAVKLN